MICLSEKNYQNFKKIIIPLLGAFSEIYHCLKKLDSKNYTSNLFNDEVFFILYIIILNQNIPNNIKDAFGFIFEINENFNNFNFTMKPLIFNLKENKINLDWYYFIIFYFIEFFLLYYGSKEKVPSKFIKQLNLILEEEQNLVDNKTKDSKNLEIMRFLNDFIIKINSFEKEKVETNFSHNEKFSKFIIYMAKIFLNVEIMKGEENKNSKYYNIFKDFLVKLSKNIENDKEIINNFKYYKNKFEFLKSLFDFLEEKDFISENKLLFEEIVDYQKQYHHLMKELFIFNRLWSDQKLFFKNNSEEMKKSKLKYKNINYYTRNFQKPIIYPYLDYKNRYPKFSSYKINKDLYLDECDNPDFYNFDLDCPELDTIIKNCNEDKINKIKKLNGKEDIKIKNVCFIKQQYHVKGDFFLSQNSENTFSIYFYSYKFDQQNNYKEKPNCNKKKSKESKGFKESEANLCYGSIFKCPEKECNRKLIIDSDDIRLIMKRIYFYRKSSIEIFTNTKAYYFNFENEEKMSEIFDFIEKRCNKIYFSIKNRNEVNGLLKINPNILQSIEEKENFVDSIKGHISKGQCFEMSTFDLILFINLVSNRSFNDLHQYPVFPLLYFYNKQNKNFPDRDLKEHIGFQDVSEEAKKRKKLLKDIFDGSKTDDDVEDQTLCFFNTHYSNIVYTSNYLIRLFPFSSLSIELQGDGFDNPNRLFFSIQETFFNISTQKADLRELIPEFFYFPEMFININYFNFRKRNNNQLVDDVTMPDNFSKNNITELDFEKKSHKGKNENLNNNNDEKYFLFVEDMKNRLEQSRSKIHNWLDLIFGSFQDKNSKNQQYFRKESYLENEKEEIEKCINDDDTMKSVEFGVIPLKTINDKKSFKDKNYDYECLEYKKEKKSIKNEQESSKEISDSINNQNSQKNIYEKYENDNYFPNKNNDYWDVDLNIDFKINKENGDGEVEIYRNGILIDELMDHNDEILKIFYNKRLNMFAATSKDGFIYVYIIPNKLFSVIKHPNNRYYNNVFLSANPFPTIVAYDEKEKSLTSYSLSGIMIKKIKIKDKDKEKEKIKENKKEKEKEKISPLFNIYGGTFKDRLKISSENQSKIIFCNIPFFDKVDSN